MRETKKTGAIERLVEACSSNEKLMDAVSEDMRKISLLLFATGFVGFFAQGSNVKITPDEAKWLTICGFLIYMISVAIIALNSTDEG